MNRERLLLVAVVAIVALWFFVLKEDVTIETGAKTGTQKLVVLPVRSAADPEHQIPDQHGGFTQFTNETEYPRPDLASMPEITPKSYDLSNICPPTTYAPGIDKLGMLRRPGKAPAEGDAASISLPPMVEDTGTTAKTATIDRYDSWSSLGRPSKGRIVEIITAGGVVREPAELPEPGAAAMESPFYRLLLSLSDPAEAAAAGVREVRARLLLGDKLQGSIKQRYGTEMKDFQVCSEGSLQGWFDGMRAALRWEGKTDFNRPFEAGKALLTKGVGTNDKAVLKWALYVLELARTNVPKQGAQVQRNQILLLMMDAASRLNMQERVLALAFEHLRDFPREEEVLEYVGNIVGSRSYGLDDYARRFYALAPGNQFAQRRLIEKLIKLGRFEEARDVLGSGRAGAGPAVDLLHARVALALGDLSGAEERARNLTGGDEKATAYQVLGGIAYARGNMEAAAEHFRNAVDAAPGRSTAYSDLGLALAVQGKAADATACFQRARALDRIDNIVSPRVGLAYLEMNAGDFAAAAARLEKIRDDNPNAVLVRVLLGYAREKEGNLDEAAKLYRATLDDDHRYRIAIARLGFVQAQRAERDDDDKLAKEAVAHLKKAVDLNPDDAILPYILGRFLLRRQMQPRLAKDMFARAANLRGREGADDKLPAWADLGQVCIDYRNPAIDERRIKGQITRLRRAIKDSMSTGLKEEELIRQHEVYAAATEALAVVQETEGKVNKTWTFPSKPRPPWKLHAKDPMKVNARANRGLVFSGEIDYGGQSPGFVLPLESCAAEYTNKGQLDGKTFYELVIEGTIPEGAAVKFGVGLVNPTRSKRKGPTGIQIMRNPRGNAELRLDGGASDLWKKLRAESYVDCKKVAWPAGKFTLHIKVERGEEAQKEGRFRMLLNGINVFEQEFGDKTERSVVFGRGRSNQALSIFLWVEGDDGTRIPDINVSKVVLTKAKK